MPPEQGSYIEQTGEGLQQLFTTILHFQAPTREQIVNALEGISNLQAVGLVVIGIIFLFFGFRFFKAVVVINGIAIGGILGTYIGSTMSSNNTPLVMGLAGAALLGVIAYPTVKYAVGLMGALAGGLIGYILWYSITSVAHYESIQSHAWVGAVVGVIIVGMLTFVAFHIAVMIFTSVQGALMVVGGILSILLSASEQARTSFKPLLIGNDLLLTVIIAVPAAIGFTLQLSSHIAKVKKKRKATEKPPV